MPRPLVLGNSSLLINYDRFYQIRDLYFPFVGQYNHVVNETCKFGVFLDGKMVWSTDPGWKFDFQYIAGTLIGRTQLRHDELGIILTIHEDVDKENPFHFREILIESNTDEARTIKVFFHTDLRIQETDIGDTALYHPDVDGIIHYKFKYAFLFGGRSREKGLAGYTTGTKEWKKPVGAWTDAEDGVLGANAISQGAVDSIYYLESVILSSVICKMETWMVIGDSIPDAIAKFTSWRDDGFLGANFVKEAEAQAKNLLFGFASDEALSAEQLWLYEQSQLIVASQCDKNGAITAANDGDILETNRATYSFVWPRDGALVGQAMDLAGKPEINRAYQFFASKLVSLEQPYFLHKYAPDGSLGASWHPLVVNGERVIPFQQDETALTIYSLGQHIRTYGDQKFLEKMYFEWVKSACDFMIKYRDSDGIPKPSWDLWEERRGVHCYTLATTIAALREASWMADQLDQAHDADHFSNIADKLVEILKTRFWNPKRGAFYRMLGDETIDSATLSVVLFRALEPNHPQAVMAVNTVDQILNDKKGIGGVGRYEGDYYFRKSEDFPGNPWIICTMWLAQVRMMQAKCRDELSEQKEALDWVVARAEKTGILGEQYHPATGEALSVSPLTWSHAEYIASVGLFKKRWKELE